MAMIGPVISSIALIVRLLRRQAVRQSMLDVLDHHDRVVDDDADRQHQAEQREVVEAEAQQRHDGERADERHGHGDQRQDHRPPVLQEEQHDDGHQDDRVAQRLEDFVDRFVDERRRVVDDGVVDARGERAASAPPSWP